MAPQGWTRSWAERVMAEMPLRGNGRRPARPEPTVQELNASLIHDWYCPKSDACRDPECGFRPVA